MKPLSMIVCALALGGCTTLPAPAPNAPPAGARQNSGAEPLAGFQARDAQEQRLLNQIRAEPANPEPWYRLGNQLAKSERLNEAEQAYREALKQGSNSRALNNLGLVQIRLGAQALKEAREQMPENTAARAETRRFVQLLLRSAL